MGSNVHPIRGTISENSGAYLMARVLGHGGIFIVAADIASIVATIYDLETGISPPPIASGPISLVVPDVVFNALQTNTLDPRWTRDRVGYNFGMEALASWFPNGGHFYRVECKFTPVIGQQFYVIFDITVLETFS